MIYLNGVHDFRIAIDNRKLYESNELLKERPQANTNQRAYGSLAKHSRDIHELK